MAGLVGRTDSVATRYLRPSAYRQYSRHTTSRARVAQLHLSMSTGSRLVFRLRGPMASKLISHLLHGSRSAVTIFLLLFRSAGFAFFGDLLAVSVTRTKTEPAVLLELPLQWLWRCVSLWRQMRWNKSEFEEGLPVPTCGLALFCGIRTSSGQILENLEDALVGLSMNIVYEYPARSKEMFKFRALTYVVQFLSAGRCTFENCTSRCPSRNDGSSNKKKRQHKNAAYHFMKRIVWRSNTK